VDWLAWQISAPLSAITLILAVAIGLNSRRANGLAATAAVLRELALIGGLYSLWQLAGAWSVMHVDRAHQRGLTLWHLERWLHLPSEVSVQHVALHAEWVVKGANLYYASVHAPALGIFLVWLFFQYRQRYPQWRNVIALTTFACLALQLVPVAPPRMFPDLGFVDTAQLFHQSVYGALGSGLADQLSAMPSVHVAWAVIIGLAVVTTSTSRWRWLVLAHPVITVFVVVVTANHWWLDGIAAVGLMLGAIAVDRAVRLAWRRRGGAFLATGQPEPDLVEAMS
jgi:hypothetical protein